MGMGEPLLNVANVTRALDLLEDEVSPRRTTVSTAGVVPGIEALAGRPRRPNLAVSLSGADDETRTRLMPINRTYPLAELFAALKRWPLERGRRITFEYVLIAGVNDRPEDAAKLAALVKPLPSKVNLIPLNESAEWLPGLKRPVGRRRRRVRARRRRGRRARDGALVEGPAGRRGLRSAQGAREPRRPARPPD